LKSFQKCASRGCLQFDRHASERSGKCDRKKLGRLEISGRARLRGSDTRNNRGHGGLFGSSVQPRIAVDW
jgi:hypothetical protein